jgi:UDP-N-acetylglucosamine diphosphorylase/glucosamine-1-phosphate N-acetyltransferase
MNIILFDDPLTKRDLLPFTYTRPVAHIRLGILEVKEKWEKWLPADYSYLTEAYLSRKFSQNKSPKNLYLNGSVLPNQALVDALKSLAEDRILHHNGLVIAAFGNFDDPEELSFEKLINQYKLLDFESDFMAIRQVYDIFKLNRQSLIDDFQLLTSGRKSAPIDDPHTVVYNRQQVFVEEGSRFRAAIINAESGPVYIGREVEIGEGSIIKGATSIGDYSVLNLGTKIRGDATIGPYCKVGGEVSNSVIFGYSSKAHDGFLGNSVVGEWCNLGADTNTSNLKNNYTNVRIWNYNQERFADTGSQFCGLMMGDHSKCGINTMFNTGTVVGISANIFGSGFPRAFIPSFSWGGAQGFVTFQLEKALEVMPKVMERRKKFLTQEDKMILAHIFETTKKYRSA